jgi:membrane protease subunit HflK
MESGNIFDNLKIPPQLKNILKRFRLIALFLLLSILSFSSVFQIETEEVGVITRFGKYIRTVEPGLNAKIPFIETLYRVPVEKQQKMEFGFRTTNANVQSSYRKDKVTEDESLMLTGDLNLADVEWVVQYRVKNARNYLFNVRNLDQTLRDIAESAMRQIVGDRTVNEVLTVGRADIGGKLERLVQEVCDDYQMGLQIDQVVLQDVNPPDPVKDAFNAVNEAQQEKETLINQAKSEYNKVIPKAKGQAQETIQKAEGYATERVNNAQGEVARFNSIYQEYVKARDVTKKRIYLESMQEILNKTDNIIITDEDGNNVVPLLQMQMNQLKKTEQ